MSRVPRFVLILFLFFVVVVFSGGGGREEPWGRGGASIFQPLWCFIRKSIHVKSGHLFRDFSAEKLRTELEVERDSFVTDTVLKKKKYDQHTVQAFTLGRLTYAKVFKVSNLRPISLYLKCNTELTCFKLLTLLASLCLLLAA